MPDHIDRIGSDGTESAVLSARPPYLRPVAIVAVAVGGLVGTTARHLLEVALPGADGAWPATTFGINVAGALLLGILLESLTRAGPDTGIRQLIRLGGGTGALGSFTTYSTLALDVDLLVHGGEPITAATYAVGTVGIGLIAATVGIAIGTRIPAARSREKGTVR